jgi:hypothetical protein
VTHYHACDDEDCHLANPGWARLHMNSWSYVDYRWRNTRTHQVQSELHPRLSLVDWVRDKRSTIKLTGDWEQVDEGGG